MSGLVNCSQFVAPCKQQADGEKVEGGEGGTEGGGEGGWNATTASIKSECLTRILSIPLTFISPTYCLPGREILSILLPSLHSHNLTYQFNGKY